VDWDEVDVAVEEMAGLLRADGADLQLVDANAKTARIEVALDLSGVECLDCVLAPEFLEQMITDTLARHVRGEFELILRDPRRPVSRPT
jgi:Fe-S cluster biogenesis protein NfuA